jgi:hypothetical protein
MESIRSIALSRFDRLGRIYLALRLFVGGVFELAIASHAI